MKTASSRAALTSLFMMLISMAAIFFLNLAHEQTLNPLMIKMAPWLLARACGVAAYLILTVLVVVGIVLASVPNRESWRLGKILLPFHRLLALFLIAFLSLHIVALLLDSYAKLSVTGAFIPLFSLYRPLPVALGTLSLYAIMLLAITARFPKILPANRWLTIHRVAFLTFALAFFHGVLTGSDTPFLRLMYESTLAVVLCALFLRYAFIPNRLKQVQDGLRKSA